MKKWRILFLIIIVFIIGSGVLARLFSLQILQYDNYIKIAEGQHGFYKTLYPHRGEIFMQDLSVSRRSNEDAYCPLAINKDFEEIYIVPKKIQKLSIEDREKLANELSLLLNLDKELILQRMNKEDDPYEPLTKKSDFETVNKIKDLNIDGLETSLKEWRYYPNNELASHLIGFVGIIEQGNIGQYGLEGYYENELKGKKGLLEGEKDTSGYRIPFLSHNSEPAENGSKLILTIDQNIQFKVEKELSQAIEKYDAESGNIIIMQPKTGAILAIANLPSFNPNEYSKVEDIRSFLNPSIQELYEPGSVFKPITMAMGLDTGKVNPKTVYEDKGRINVGGSIIGNVDGKTYGTQTMTQVLEKSLNTGAYFVQEQVGRESFQDYIQRFNLNKLTGIDLTGEVNGNISNAFTRYDIDLATISFGQGIAITPIELIAAIGTIANEGKIMRPFVVDKIIHPDGAEENTEPEIRGDVISLESAKELVKMMVNVTENGSGRLARIDNYNIATKTGTAQIPDFEKGGYIEDVVHSFVGFAPAFNPEFVMLIKLDKPHGLRFAASSCGPIFKEISKYLFNYLEIPPQ